MSEHRPQIDKDLHGRTHDAFWLHEALCDECGQCGRDNLVRREDLETFCARVFEHHGVRPDRAATTARVLVSADLRGIVSHGVARLGRYLTGIQAGYIVPGAKAEVEEPAPALAVVDAKNGLGQAVSEMAMDLAIDKAKKHGVGAVTVRNSNHYGIAGYYVLRALEHDLIGLSMTNSAPLVIPTHGARALLGTNPIAFGAPAGRHRPFLLDTATSVVPRGKLEVYDRNRKQMPRGWAVDENGYDTQNAGQVLRNLIERIGGGILPLGGRGEEFGGHKGYGLAMLVDILSGVLSGSAFGPEVHNLKREVPPGEVAAPRVGHFFLALDIARFTPLEAFRRRMDAFLDLLRDSPKALDQERIWIHGEKEYLKAEENEANGIPLADNVFRSLSQIAADCGLQPPSCKLR